MLFDKLNIHASLGMHIGIDLLLAISALLQTLDRHSPSLSFCRVQLAEWFIDYSLWKQSTREIAASLAISGSICLPRGVERRRLKFWRSGLQCWLALMAVTNKSYLHDFSLTFRRGCVWPWYIIIETTIFTEHRYYHHLITICSST